MDWSFLEGWWERLTSSRQEAIRREREAQIARADRDRAHEKSKSEEEDRADRLIATLLLSEENRRQLQQLRNDIDDASRAVHLAYERAAGDAEAAETALEEARRRAIVLLDRRRVYFDADGRLFGEDGGEISDAAELQAARRARDLKPDATSYESYLKKRQNFDEANVRMGEVSQTLQRLRDLKERIEAGNITAEQLAVTRKELDDEVHSMSPEMREEYECLRAARSSGIFVDDAAPSAPTILYSDFTRASHALTAQSAGPSAGPAAAKLAYKDAPEF